jgi:hypothetical protein
MTDGAALTGHGGKRVTGPAGKALMIPHFNKGTAPNVTGTRDPTGELEQPRGQWNRLELVLQGGHIWQYVNGKLANEGTDAFLRTAKPSSNRKARGLLSQPETLPASRL